MTPEQVRYAAVKYYMRLETAGAVAVRSAPSTLRPNERTQVDHSAWMCHEICNMYGRGDMKDPSCVEKAMRWLGFVQGVLWASGIYSIDEMKDDNRSVSMRSAAVVVIVEDKE